MPFDSETTTNEVLQGTDLTGRVAVITGATSGLGLETARALAAHGATVVLAARDAEKLEGAVTTLAGLVPGATVGTQLLDLASLDSVRAGAAALAATYPRIDLLINNAGVMACPLARTVDGFEMQFGTNHLGHFLLTNLLLDPLRAAPRARVVCLSSAGHQESPIRWDDPNFETTDYFNWTAYGQSKTANALFALELDRRYSADGLHAFSVHPGVIMTPLSRHMTDADFAWMGERAERVNKAAAAAGATAPAFLFKSVEAGAATTVWAATAAELAAHGGAYLADCQVAERAEAGAAATAGVAPHACDPDAARRLWLMSAAMVGLPPE